MSPPDTSRAGYRERDTERERRKVFVQLQSVTPSDACQFQRQGDVLL